MTMSIGHFKDKFILKIRTPIFHRGLERNTEFDRVLGSYIKVKIIHSNENCQKRTFMKTYFYLCNFENEFNVAELTTTFIFRAGMCTSKYENELEAQSLHQ